MRCLPCATTHGRQRLVGTVQQVRDLVVSLFGESDFPGGGQGLGQR